jgi:ABC-2 type transport system ATP-binding protein
MSIKVEHISKVYGKQYALDDVSMEIGSGEIVGFLGPNGAGKSTLMKILTTYIQPTSGEAWICGHHVVDAGMEVRKMVGYLPEHNPLYLEMYVREYLELVAGLHGLKNNKARIAEMIDRVGLEVEAHKRIGALSKGYRQRVGLAQALIHDPAVLILDEPTSGLDPNQLVDIRNVIKQLGKEKTVMLSTHIMQEVEAICDRVIIINKGRLVTDKDAKNLVSEKGEIQVLTVEFGENVLTADLELIEGVELVNHLQGNIFELNSAVGADLRKTIFDWAVAQGIPLLSQQVKKKNLEDVFKELTKSKK